MESRSAEGHPYQLVAASMAAKIQRGVYAPDQRLPSVRTLAKDYGVTVTTAQKAVRVLVDDGLVRTRGGLGMFVVDRPSETRRQESIESISRRLDELSAAVAGLTDRLERLEEIDGPADD